MRRIILGPIIGDTKFIGLFDGDPRITELAEKLITTMGNEDFFNLMERGENKTLSLREESLMDHLRLAAVNCSCDVIEQAVNMLYDYADDHEIWLEDGWTTNV